MVDPIRLGEDGLYSFELKPAPLTILEHLLDPEISHVWVVGYMPERYLKWWTGLVQLAPSASPRPLEVRWLKFEFQAETAEFLRLLPEIPDEQSLVLYQMRRRVPNTL